MSTYSSSRSRQGLCLGAHFVFWRVGLVLSLWHRRAVCLLVCSWIAVKRVCCLMYAKYGQTSLPWGDIYVMRILSSSLMPANLIQQRIAIYGREEFHFSWFSLEFILSIHGPVHIAVWWNSRFVSRVPFNVPHVAMVRRSVCVQVRSNSAKRVVDTQLVKAPCLGNGNPKFHCSASAQGLWDGSLVKLNPHGARDAASGRWSSSRQNTPIPIH